MNVKVYILTFYQFNTTFLLKKSIHFFKKVEYSPQHFVIYENIHAGCVPDHTGSSAWLCGGLFFIYFYLFFVSNYFWGKLLSSPNVPWAWQQCVNCFLTAARRRSLASHSLSICHSDSRKGEYLFKKKVKPDNWGYQRKKTEKEATPRIRISNI